MTELQYNERHAMIIYTLLRIARVKDAKIGQQYIARIE